jgi:hypothetical protein
MDLKERVSEGVYVIWLRIGSIGCIIFIYGLFNDSEPRMTVLAWTSRNLPDPTQRSH